MSPYSCPGASFKYRHFPPELHLLHPTRMPHQQPMVAIMKAHLNILTLQRFFLISIVWFLYMNSVDDNTVQWERWKWLQESRLFSPLQTSSLLSQNSIATLAQSHHRPAFRGLHAPSLFHQACLQPGIKWKSRSSTGGKNTKTKRALKYIPKARVIGGRDFAEQAESSGLHLQYCTERTWWCVTRNLALRS